MIPRLSTGTPSKKRSIGSVTRSRPCICSLTHGGRGELLAHRTDVVDGLAAGRGVGLVIGLAPAPAGHQLAVERRHQAPARPVGYVGRVEHLGRSGSFSGGSARPTRTTRAAGQRRRPRPPASVADASPADGLRLPSLRAGPAIPHPGVDLGLGVGALAHAGEPVLLDAAALSGSRPGQRRRERLRWPHRPRAPCAGLRRVGRRSASPPRSSPNASRAVPWVSARSSARSRRCSPSRSPHRPRVGEQAELQQPAPHASPGVRRAADAARRGPRRSSAAAPPPADSSVSPGCGQPVVAAAPALDLLLARRLDQAVGGQPVQRAVERAGGEPDPPVGQLLDVAGDAVAVALALRQAGQDVQRLLGHAADYTSSPDVSRADAWSDEDRHRPAPRRRAARRGRGTPRRARTPRSDRRASRSSARPKRTSRACSSSRSTDGKVRRAASAIGGHREVVGQLVERCAPGRGRTPRPPCAAAR